MYYSQIVPAMAASIRLRVGLGGSEGVGPVTLTFCSGKRVFSYLIIFESPREVNDEGS